MTAPIDLVDFGTVDPKLPTPLYHQIYMLISDKIRTGDIPMGAIIPGEVQLAETMNVSRITVKRAFNELANAGLVARRRGRGTVVIANTDLNFHDPISDYVENVERLRMNTDTDLLSRETLVAPEKVTQKLGLNLGDTVEKICHSLSLKGKALSYVETFVPHGLTQSVTDLDLSDAPILSLLRRQGVKITRAEQRIFAVSATKDIAALMDIEVGTPLLKIHCVMIDEDDRPVEDIYAWYHSERYEYQMTLSL